VCFALAGCRGELVCRVSGHGPFAGCSLFYSGCTQKESFDVQLYRRHLREKAARSEREARAQAEVTAAAAARAANPTAAAAGPTRLTTAMALIDSSVGGLFGSPRLPAGRTRAAATTDDSALVFRCPACGKSLHSKEALRYHTNPNTTACDARFSPEERWRRRSQNRAIGARNRRDNAAFGRNKFGVSTPGARATAAAQRPINQLFARLGGAATAAPAATGVGNTGDGAAAADSTGEGTATAADEDRALGEDRTAEEHEDDTQPPRRRQQYSLSMVQFADAVKESIDYFGYRMGVLVRVVKVTVFVRRPYSFTSPVAFGGVLADPPRGYDRLLVYTTQPDYGRR
jgi:hypothetical protein